jgi:hypoxia up-regulated 1
VYVPSRDIVYTVEELMAMILMDARDMAVKMAQEPITDCVVAISPEFDNFQKAALRDSLKIAGLKPLAFVSENMAAAIRYGVDGLVTKNTSTVMYINMGAASFKVSVMRHQKETSEDKKVVERITTIGEAWDKTLGGRQFDYEVVEMLADKFNSLPERKGKTDIRRNEKAMRKLLAAAEDYKQKFTAAKLLKVYVDNLENYVNLVGEIIREDFEYRIAKYEPRVIRVINEAFKDANITFQDLDAIELIGSGLRVPLIMDMIVKGLNGTKPGQRLNQEEAMSFGSGFLAARLSYSFKVKTVLPTLSTTYDISMELKNTYDTLCTDTIKHKCTQKPFYHKTMLMKRKEKYDLGKSVKIPFVSDFMAELYENVFDIDESPTPRKLATFRITGVNEMAEKLSDDFRVHLRFETDDLGLITLKYAKAVVSKTVEGNSTEKGKKIEEEHMLNVEREDAYPSPMNSEQIKESKKKIKEIVEKEEKELERVREMNGFESTIYNVRDWVNDENNAKFIDIKTKEKLNNYLAEVSSLIRFIGRELVPCC